MSTGRLKQRLESMRSSMEVAKHLDDSPLNPVPLGTPVEDIEAIIDKHRLDRRIISHFLNALVLEIAIKVIWELDNAKECRYIHDIYQLYQELDPASQSDLNNLFNEKATIIANMEGDAQDGTRIRIGDLVQFQSWEDTLRANRDIMQNFKYDGEFNGKSSAMGSVMWNNETLWIFPGLNFVRFPEAVYQYVYDRLQKIEKEEKSIE